MVVVFHEIAHVVHFRVFTPQQVQAYRQLYRRSGSDPGNFIGPLLRGRRYATTNEYEDFAELFAAYTEDSDRVVRFVRDRLSKNETILFEKLKILFDVLMGQSQPQSVFVYRSEVWDGAMPDGNFRGGGAPSLAAPRRPGVAQYSHRARLGGFLAEIAHNPLAHDHHRDRRQDQASDLREGTHPGISQQARQKF
jgi:hypothetical protein